MKKASIGSCMVVALAFAGAGCVAQTDPGDPGEVTPSKAEQAVSSFGIWSWGCSTNPCQLPLGPVKDRTCFLAGVWGNLQSSSGLYSEVSVLKSGSQWGLQVTTNNSHPLGGTAVCISTPNATANTFQWFADHPPTSLGSGATRRCFLAGVRNINGFTGGLDSVQVRLSGTNWLLDGNQVGKDTVAFATCVDVPVAAAFDHIRTAVDGATPPPLPIQANNPGGWACALKKLSGHFTTSDYNDGIWLDDSSDFSEWNLNVVNGKTGIAGCVR